MLAGRKHVKYLALTCLWIASAVFFWTWWLEPSHNLDTSRFWAASSFMGWSYFTQCYFMLLFLNGRRSTAPDPKPGQWRVAMVVTKAPSEPLSLLKKTLTAMLAQDYPHDTWLADEDPSPETIAWCEANGVRISTRKGVADYHRATWPRRTRCKEGNLAYFYDHFGYDGYDIVAQLDADHVPQPGYLREMLRPFADPAVGYVSAPSICNANAAESWAARTRLDAEAAFHGLLQTGQTGLLTPMCIGSHYAVRTTALKAVGGLGPDLAEDHSTTLLLAAGGWRGVHAIDAIAYGDGPANLADLATQEFQWARSLTTLLLSHTGRYLGRLPLQLKFLFIFGQIWYPVSSALMLFLYLVPIYSLVNGVRFADVTYPAFVGHSLPNILVLIFYAFQLRSDGFFRPYDGKVMSKEKIMFVYLQWPWALWGCVTALRDKITGKFVDFRVTPKGEAATKKLPTKVVAAYSLLALGALLPVLLVRDISEARGFYILSAINGLIYTAIAVSIVLRHLMENGAELRRRWHAAAVQLASVGALTMLVGTVLTTRGVQGIYALSVGMAPFHLAVAEYGASGAGMDDYRKVMYRFDPGWN